MPSVVAPSDLCELDYAHTAELSQFADITLLRMEQPTYTSSKRHACVQNVKDMLTLLVFDVEHVVAT